MTIELKTTKQVQETICFDIPCFLKRGDDKYIGIFEESEVIGVYKGYQWSFIEAGTIDMYKQAIAAGGWESIDEQEFRVEYEKALKLISLPKRQITTAELSEAI